MTEEFTPKVWLLQHVEEPDIRSTFCGVFLTLESAQQHVKKYHQIQYMDEFKTNLEVWQCTSPGFYESRTLWDLKYTLELVPLEGITPSSLIKFAWGILQGDPMAVDAAQDVLARGG